MQKQRFPGADGKRLQDAIDIVLDDMMHKRIPPHSHATTVFLNFYKDSKQFDQGKQFLSRVARKDEEYMTAPTYGAAIELLAVAGEPLSTLEEMFTAGQKHSPGLFTEYHLSPNAIVQDRSQPSVVPGTSMNLLKGIITARLLHRDWRGAYLALDTAFRLHAYQVPSDMIGVFLSERPLKESYKVFLMACRSGNIVDGSHLMTLLVCLADAQHTRNEPPSNAVLANAMANAVYAYYSAGGSPNILHMNALIRGVLGSLLSGTNYGETSPATHTKPQDHEQLPLEKAKEVLELLEVLQLSATTATFNTIISIAGQLKSQTLIDYSLRELKDRRLEMNEITLRTILNTAGDLSNTRLIETTWESLVEVSLAQSQRVSPENIKDWKALIRAGCKAGHLSYVEAQLSQHRESMDSGVAKQAARELQREVGRTLSPAPCTISNILPTHAEHMDAEMRELNARLKELGSLIQSGRVHDHFKSRIPMSPWRSSGTASSNHDRDIYEQLSTDPLQRELLAQTPPEAPFMTKTCFPLDELRYENWRSTNELMHDAEVYEARRQNKVEEAVAGGQPMLKYDRELILGLEKDEIQYIRSDPWASKDFMDGRALESAEQSRSSPTDHILRLRGITPERASILMHDTVAPLQGSLHEEDKSFASISA